MNNRFCLAILILVALAITACVTSCATTKYNPDGTVAETIKIDTDALRAMSPVALEAMKTAMELELSHQETLSVQALSAKQQALQTVVDVVKEKKTVETTTEGK